MASTSLSKIARLWFAALSTGLLILSMSSEVSAGPPKLWFQVTAGPQPYPVNSREEVCAEWKKYELIPENWTSLGLAPNPPYHEYQTNSVDCLYTRQNDAEVYQVSPGWVTCVPPGAGATSFVIDPSYSSCVCPAAKKYSAETDTCVTVQATPGDGTGDPSNNGCPTCNSGQPKEGEPIEAGTGNMWHIETDYVSQAPGSKFRIVRTYNSNPLNWDENVPRTFGKRWTQAVDVSLRPLTPIPASGPVTCWKNVDTLHILWCDEPALPALNVLPDSAGVLRSDGKQYYFNRSGTIWTANGNTADKLSSTWNADQSVILDWTYLNAADDSIERFSADGKLLSVTQRNGFSQRYTYSDGVTNDSSAGRFPIDAPVCNNVQAGPVLPAGRRLCVTDEAGRQMQFEYDKVGRITKVLDPTGQAYLYEFDGPSSGCHDDAPDSDACIANNLTKVTYPDGKSRIYYYNESAQINGGVQCSQTRPIADGHAHLFNTMTGLVDENGARHISWTYACDGRATSSERAGGVEKVRFGYGSVGAGSTYVTHVIGTPAQPQDQTRIFWNKAFNNTRLVTQVDAPCVECGPIAARTFDLHGNVTSTLDWNNNLTCYAYDSARQLQTAVVEGNAASGTCSTILTATTLASPARKTSTRWNANFRLPDAIAEPKRLTTFQYDGAGNLLSKKEQATTDANGVLGFAAQVTGTARTWTYTYNSFNQVRTVTGPRTDVNNVTTYDYDGQHNLATITNAAGHRTTFSNYDANGHVGQITDANNLVTELHYSARGWIDSASVGGELTSYEHDGVGQLTRTTRPDNSFVQFDYDGAHRLYKISDNLGNTINYVLDLRGNRTGEQVLDPNSVLTRQVTRIFDGLSRLQQVTGGQQ